MCSAARCCAAVFALLCAASVSQAKNKAILVGVASYQDTSIPSLQYCVNDVDALRRTLIDVCGYHPDDVIVMHTGVGLDQFHLVPAKKHIQKMVGSFKDNTSEDDTILFFFSGHGFVVEGEGVLATWDYQRDETDSTSTLTTQELKSWLAEVPAKRKFLVLDCCHAAQGNQKGLDEASKSVADRFGTEISKVSSDPILDQELEEAYRESKGFVTFSSCKSDESSYEWEDKEHGLFTFYLIQGLGGEADASGNRDGTVSHTELYQYVAAKVPFKARVNWNVEQHPTLYTEPNASGLFPLAKAPRPQEKLVASGPQLPPPPGLLADQAFHRLKGAKGFSDKRTQQDLALLIDEAQRLRETEDLNRAQRLNHLLDNPFFNADRADKVYDWLTLVQAKYEQNRSGSTPDSALVSLALASWHKKSRDGATAGKAIGELARRRGSFEEIAPELQLQLQLLQAQFQRRSGSFSELQQALKTYAGIIDVIRREERFTRQRLDNEEYEQLVLLPAKEVAEKLASTTDLQVKSQAAQVLAAYGHVIARAREKSRLLESRSLYRKAAQLTPHDSEILVGLADVELSLSNAKYDHVRAISEAAIKHAQGDHVVKGIAFRLWSDAVLEQGQKLQRVQERIDWTKSALQGYQAALEHFRQAEDSLTAFEKKHYASACLGRSAACLEFASLGRYDPLSRERYLEEAVLDAVRAAEVDPTVGYQARLALGQARENSSWLANKEQGYVDAQSDYRVAISEFPNQPDGYLHLGRCLFKAGDLSGARDQLEYSLLFADRPLAHYFLAKIALEQGNYDAAEKRFADVERLLAKEDHDLNPKNVRDLSQQYAQAPLDQAMKILAKSKIESVEREVRALLAETKRRAAQLEEHDPLQAYYLKGRRHEALAQIALRKSKRVGITAQERSRLVAELVTELKNSLSLYDTAMTAENADKDDRVWILCRRAELTLDAPQLYKKDFSQARPPVLNAVSEAHRLAKELIEEIKQQEQENRDALLASDLKQATPEQIDKEFRVGLAVRLQRPLDFERWALGLMGAAYARYHTYLRTEQPNATNIEVWKSAAEQVLRNILPKSPTGAPNNDKDWRWAYELAQLLAGEAASLKRQNKSFEKIKKEAIGWLDFAYKHSNDALVKPNISQLRSIVKNL